MEENDKPKRHPLRLLTVALIVFQALLVLLASIRGYMFLSSAAQPAEGLALGYLIFTLIFMVLLLLAAKSLYNFGRFGVSYTITWQLFQALVAGSMINGGLVIPGFIALSLAVIVFFLCLNQSNKPKAAL